MRHENVINADGTTAAPLLSVCIPTHGRAKQAAALVGQLRPFFPDVEICVHVDGLQDGTAEVLRPLAARGLKVTIGDHQGPAAAFKSALALASGRFVMKYDDDDAIVPANIPIVLDLLRLGPSEGSCGFIFQMNDQSGRRLGSDFPERLTNFVKLRTEQGVLGDKKEVVLRHLLLRAIYSDYGQGARVPSSLIWTKLALDHDVDAINLSIGTKEYSTAGLTARMRHVKAQNPMPMADLYRVRVASFFAGRHRSVVAFARDLLGAGLYSWRRWISRWSRR